LTWVAHTPPSGRCPRYLGMHTTPSGVEMPLFATTIEVMPLFATTIEVMCHHFHGGVTCVSDEAVLRIRWAFFLPFFSILSHCLDFHVSPSKNQLCPSIYIYINFDYHSFNCSFFRLWCFFNFIYFSISSIGIIFHLFFISNLVLILWLLFFCFFLSLSWFFFNFISHQFISFNFCFQFWFSFFWLLFFLYFFKFTRIDSALFLTFLRFISFLTASFDIKLLSLEFCGFFFVFLYVGLTRVAG